MARPPISSLRRKGLILITLFKPAGATAPELEQLQLTVFDELEAIRLVDLEALSHEQAAEAMGISRQTVGRALERGWCQGCRGVVDGKAILIGGGQYRLNRRACTVRLPRSSGSQMPKSRSRDFMSPGRLHACARAGVSVHGRRAARTDATTATTLAALSRAPAAAALGVSGASAGAKRRSTNQTNDD